MGRLLTALAIVVGPMFAQDAVKPQVPEEEAGQAFDPAALEGRLFRGTRDAPAVSMRLRRGGVIEVDAGEVKRDVTLDDLGALLAKARDEDDLAQRKVGKSGFEEILPGIKATRLFLSLAADRIVPWQHIQWIMAIAAEQGYRKLEMSEGTRILLVYLPVPVNVDYIDPPLGIVAAVHLAARVEQPATWGDLEVRVPTGVRFKYADRETRDIADVAAYLRESKKVAEDVRERAVVLYGEITAGHKVPYAKVFDVMETFVEAGIDVVDLCGAAIPPKEVRKVERLPYPAKICD